MGLERGRLSAEKLMKLMKAMLLVKHVRQDKVAVQVCPGVWLGSIGAAYNKEFIQVRTLWKLSQFKKDFSTFSIQRTLPT